MTSQESSNPFTRYDFLALLEASGAVGGKSGWSPKHLIVESEGQLIGLMPMYEKLHSWGEYIFDWSWAEAYERCAIEYYPKLVAAIPFTPVTGCRLAISCQLSEKGRADVELAVINFIKNLCMDKGYSSWHCLCHDSEAFSQQDELSDWPISRRLTPQFHWQNHTGDDGKAGLYVDFDEFIGRFRSSKRKTLLKERRALKLLGIEYQWTRAGDMLELEWQQVIACYQLTYLKRSGHGGYLPPDFFTGLSRSCPDSALVLRAFRDGEVVAAALYFCSDTQLYGRYWGAMEDIPGLHFELCYYQGIEYCIEHKLLRFNAGAQGEHKLARGFEPVAVHSSHYIAHPEFARAIDSFCLQERGMTLHYIQQACDHLPFKQA